MEKWDLLDADGNFTGRTIVRGEPLLPGMYHLVEHIWIVDSKGRLLIQQRNPDLKLMPGVWAANSGSAQAGEDSESAARRELREETGAEARELIDLGDYYGSPAIMGERIRMFLTRGLTFTNQHLDDDEFLEVFRLPLDEAVRQIMAGEIPDGKTQAGILRAAMMLKK